MVHRLSLSLNSKRRIRTCRFQNYLFHLIYNRPLRAGRQIVFECFNAGRRSLRKCFDAPVSTVAHVPYYLMSRCRALCKETITDALHLTSYKELSRHALHVRPVLAALKELAVFSSLEGKRLF